MQNDLSARQAQHKRPTPRIGGVAVIAGLFVSCVVFASEIQTDLAMALLAGAVVFGVGLREDLQRNMSPRARLLAAFISAALAIILSGAVVPRFGIPYVDGIFSLFGVGLLITLLWSAGTCHALNLIDGLNGLASGYSMVAAAAYFAIGGLTGNSDVQLVSAILFVAVSGFFVLNWPYGRLFLGDAGAYAIGHALAWLGIILLVRDPMGAGLAAILILFWPVADTAFAIVRRKLLEKDTDQPDRLHYHHLVVRSLRLLTNRKFSPEVLNPAATLLLLPVIAAPVLSGVIFWHRGIAAAAALAVFGLLFLGTYVFSASAFKTRRFVYGELPTAVQEQLNGFQVEISPMSGLHVSNSLSTYVTIIKRADRSTWNLVVKSGADGNYETYEGFVSDSDAWRFFCKLR